jgi:hypothetical protein
MVGCCCLVANYSTLSFLLCSIRALVPRWNHKVCTSLSHDRTTQLWPIPTPACTRHHKTGVVHLLAGGLDCDLCTAIRESAPCHCRIVESCDAVNQLVDVMEWPIHALRLLKSLRLRLFSFVVGRRRQNSDDEGENERSKQATTCKQPHRVG